MKKKLINKFILWLSVNLENKKNNAKASFSRQSGDPSKREIFQLFSCEITNISGVVSHSKRVFVEFRAFVAVVCCFIVAVVGCFVGEAWSIVMPLLRRPINSPYRLNDLANLRHEKVKKKKTR